MREQAADALRERAASRRVALRARTLGGLRALHAVAAQADGDARRIGPLGLRR